MKTPRPKIHIKDVDSPLTSYCNIEGRCGEVLKNAEPKFMFSEDMTKYAMIPGICRRCAVLPGAKTGYLYGLVNAQEILGDTDIQ
jgi:hypothetical protein